MEKLNTYCQSVASNAVAHNHSTTIAINNLARQPFDFIRKWAFFFFLQKIRTEKTVLR